MALLESSRAVDLLKFGPLEHLLRSEATAIVFFTLVVENEVVDHNSVPTLAAIIHLNFFQRLNFSDER